MSRPADWSPLADSDPVPGDSATIASEAKYYSDAAQTISDQVARLNKMAGQGELLGKTADKLRSAAGDLSGKLQKTHGRFATVGSQLTAWVPHFEDAQRDTLKAYNDYQDAAATASKNAPPPAPKPSSTPPPTPTPAQVSAENARKTAYGNATGAMSTAKTAFDTAVGNRDAAAKIIAGKINDALHDGLKDGFWDHISAWVTQHLKMINLIITILTYVVTAVAILCIFIPGLNLLAIGLTIALLAGHTLLAATGNGSWVDVALDIFALATFGAGRLLTPIADGARGAVLARAGGLAADEASGTVQATRAVTRTAYEEAAQGLGKFTPKGFKAFVSLKTGFFDAATASKSAEAASAAKTAMLERSLPDVTAGESVRALDSGNAAILKDYGSLLDEFPGDGELSNLIDAGRVPINAARVANAAGFGIDFGNRTASSNGWFPGQPGIPAWDNFKESYSTGLFQP